MSWKITIYVKISCFERKRKQHLNRKFSSNIFKEHCISDDAWIGLKDPSTIGSWVWSYDNSKITFENWGPQEPDGDGYCACFCTEICNWNGNWNENYWNDRQCDYPTGYICKKSIVN